MDLETAPSPRELYPDPGVRILIMMRRVLPLWQFDRLTGPFFRLYWNSTPGAVIRHADQDVALSPDRVVLVPPNTPISMRLIRSPVTHFYVHFVAFEPFSRLHSKLYVFDVRDGMLQGIETLPPDDEGLHCRDWPQSGPLSQAVTRG